MKLSSSDQKIVNDFFREHVNRSFKNPMNSVRMNVDHTFEHRERIFHHFIEIIQFSSGLVKVSSDFLT